MKEETNLSITEKTPIMKELFFEHYYLLYI